MDNRQGGAGVGAATFGTYQRLDDGWVFLRLRSARQDRAPLEGSEPVIDLVVMPFNSWQLVKRRFKEKWPGLKAVSDQNIRLLHKSVELRPGFMIADYNVDGGTKENPVELQYLIIDQGSDIPRADDQGSRSRAQDGKIGLYVDAQVPFTNELRDRVHACLGAMLSGIQPRLTDEGTGATYMLKDTTASHCLAVFKPKDEEAFAPQNPRGYVGKEDTPGLRSGVLSTQQAAREVAAYLLDHDKFANVPETTLCHAKHPKFSKVKGKNGGDKTVWKIGAFQAFVEAKDTTGNFAPQVFATEHVHRIAILDIRIVNLDRNDGNLLVRCRTRGQYELVPIDHGLSLPDRLEVYTDDIAWMGWPQVQKPFGEKELAYIKALNAQLDARQLAKYLGVRRECLRLMEVTTTLLQQGAAHGLNLAEIGSIMYREDRGIDAPLLKSKLEQIIANCLDAALTVSGEKAAADAVSSTLAGLDLAPSGKIVRQGDGSSGTTPQIGPSSPVFSAASPGACGPMVGWEPPPPFSLDQNSESDAPQDGFDRRHTVSGFIRQLSGDEGLTSAKESPPPGTPAMHPKETPTPKPIRASGQSYRGTQIRQRTSAALAALHREGEDTEAEGAIFARPGLRGSDWSPELEKAFRRQISSEIARYITKHFPHAAKPGAAAAAGADPAAENGSPAPPSPVAAAPAKREEEKEEEPESDDDTSLASAFPPGSLEDGPWLRALKAAPATGKPGCDTISEADDEDGSPKGQTQRKQDEAAVAPPKPSPGKYVPPHIRRAQAAAAEAAAAEAAATAAAADD